MRARQWSRASGPRLIAAIGVAGLLLITGCGLRIVSTAALVAVPSTLFLTVYLGAMTAAVRVVRGKVRLAAAPAAAAVAVMLVFCGWALALPVVVALAVSGRDWLRRPHGYWRIRLRMVPSMDLMGVTGPREILTRRRALASLGVLAGLSAAGCASSSAATADVTVSQPPPRILWRSKPLVDGEYVLGVVPAGDFVCVGDGFGNVYGLSAASGKTLWRRTFRNNSAGYLPLAAAGGRVFAVGSGRVAALSAATGAQLWSVPAAGVQPGFPPQLPTYFVVYANDVVCVLGADGDVAGLDPRTGSRVWRHSPPGSGGFGAGAAAGNGVLYVAQTSGRVAALDVPTGRLRWAAPAPSVASTLLVTGGVIAGTPTASPSYDAGQLTFGLDQATGRLLWKKNFDTETYSSIAGEGDQVFVHVNLLNGAVTAGNAIYALAARSGRTLWHRAFPSQSIGGTIYAAGGLLYACFQDGALRALSPTTGADVWQSTALGAVDSITPGSRVVYGNAPGSPDTIYAVRP